MKLFKYTIIFCLFIIVSCDSEPEFYVWTTNIEVKYSDNTKDTILNTKKLYKTLRPNFLIKTESRRFFSSVKLVPCLVLESSYIRENLACDIKTFKIIKQERNVVDKR